jgi:hypothetical protein
LHYTKSVMSERLSDKLRTCHFTNPLKNQNKILNEFSLSSSSERLNYGKFITHSYIYCIINFATCSCIYKFENSHDIPENLGNILDYA